MHSPLECTHTHTTTAAPQMETLLRRVEHLEKSKNATRPTRPVTAKPRRKPSNKAKSPKPAGAAARVRSISDIFDVSPTNGAGDDNIMTDMAHFVFGIDEHDFEINVSYEQFKKTMQSKGMLQAIPEEAHRCKEDFKEAQTKVDTFLKDQRELIDMVMIVEGNQIYFQIIGMMIRNVMCQHTVMSGLKYHDAIPDLKCHDAILHREMSTSEAKREMCCSNFAVFTMMIENPDKIDVCATQLFAKTMLMENQFLQSCHVIRGIFSYLLSGKYVENKRFEDMCNCDNGGHVPICSNFVRSAGHLARVLQMPVVPYCCRLHALRLLGEIAASA